MHLFTAAKFLKWPYFARVLWMMLWFEALTSWMTCAVDAQLVILLLLRLSLSACLSLCLSACLFTCRAGLLSTIKHWNWMKCRKGVGGIWQILLSLEHIRTCFMQLVTARLNASMIWDGAESSLTFCDECPPRIRYPWWELQNLRCEIDGTRLSEVQHAQQEIAWFMPVSAIFVSLISDCCLFRFISSIAELLLVHRMVGLT